MAQVIRKFLDGGKPVVIKIDNNDYAYNDIEDKIWKNFNDYAKYNNWDKETTKVVREYLNYVLPELKSGNATFSNNTVTGVSLEWESDGNFNTTGKGIFKKDILNDKKAGATLGTAFLTNLFNSGVVSKYKAPELKNITINEDLQKKILEDYYGGNAEAFKEGWERMSPSERYNIFRKTLSELTYSPDEYKDIEKFNTNRAKLLALLPDNYTEITDNMSNAYNLLGGVGLKDIITGAVQENEEQTSKIPTEEELNKLWRQKAIDKGYYTEEAIAAYIEQLRKEYNQRQQQPINELKQSELFNTYKTAFDYRNDYVNTKKGLWWKKYFNINENSVGLDWNTQSKNKYDFSKKSPNSFILTIKDLSNQFRKSGKYNTYLMRGIFAEMIRSGIFEKNLTPGGVILPGSEDYNDNTAVAFVSTQNGDWKLKVISLFDFADRYGKKLNESFRKDYREANGIELPEDWLNKLNEYINNSKVQSEKEGGILKLQSGDALFQNYNTDIYDSTKDYITFRNLEIKSEQEEAANRNLTVEDLRKEKQELEKERQKYENAVKHKKSKKFGPEEYAVLTGLVGDVAETVGSFTGGLANPVTYAGAAASLGGYNAATWLDDTLTTGEKVGHTVLNVGLSAAGFIPFLGGVGTGARITRTVIKYGPLLMSLFTNIPGAYNTVSKITNGTNLKDLTNEDWTNLFYGLLTVLAGTRTGKRFIDDKRFTTASKENIKEVKTTDKGWLRISDEEYSKLKGIKAKDLSGKLSEERLRELGPLKLKKDYRHPLSNEDRKVQVRERTESNNKRILTEKEVNEKYNLGTTEKDGVNYYNVPRAYKNYVANRNAEIKIANNLRKFNKLLPDNWNFSKTVVSKSVHSTNGKPGVPSLLDKNSEGLRTQVLRGLNRGLLEEALKTLPNSPKKVTLLLASKADQDLIKANPNGLQAYVNKNGVVTLVVNDPNNPNRFLSKYNKDRFLDLNTLIETLEGKMSIGEAFAKGKQIKFYKFGGVFTSNVITKFQKGGQHSNVLFANPNQWYKNVYLNIKNDLLDKLKNAKTFEEKLKIVDAYNNMQTRHQSLYNRFTTNGQLNKNIYADEEVGKYQNDIIDDYNFVNSKGITTLWNNNAYSSPYKRSPEYGADGYEKDGKMSYGIDRFYGAQTDDRRILGRVGDFTDEELLAAKKEWLDAGAEIYDDNGYYKLRLNPGNQPENTPNDQLSNNQQPNDSYKDPVTGEIMTKLPDGTYKSVGNENTNPKSKILKIGEDVVKYIKNINPADAIALGRALWGENVNNRITDLVKQMGVSLNDPQRQNAILHGDYTAKMLAQELAGKINAATARPTSSDAGLLGALKIEAALKAQEALKRGNLEDSEMYWKTLQILNQVNNENAADEVAVGNENRSRVTAAANNRLQVEAARLSANFLLIWQPFLAGVEKRYRDEDVLRRLAEIDNWKYKITNEHEKKNDLIMENYRTRLASEIKNWTENNPKYKEYNGDFWTYFTKEVSPVYLQLIKENSREMYNRLYEGLSEYYSYIPFQLKRTPDLATQPIIAQYKFKDYSKSLKSGGTLSAAERQALKTTNEINKNIRQAARETYKNIREDKREHRKAMALVSQLSADLIKRAIG